MRTKENIRDNADGAEVASLTENLSKALEPAIKRINELTERVRETVRQLEIFKIEYEKEYNKIRTKFNAHFNKEGFVVDDADDFLLWLRCKNDSKSEVNLIEEAKKPSNYKLYHEYNLKCLYDDWDIIKELEYWEKQEIELPKQQSKKTERVTLRQFFDNDDEYKNVIKILADNGYINPDTLIWIDKKKGHKSFAASTIKKLFEFGYLNDDPTSKEILSICKNTFKLKIGIDIIKRADISSSNFGFLRPQ